MTELAFQRLDPNAALPERAHPGDAGFDLRSIEDVEVLALMDGTRTVKEIVVESFQESGDLSLDGDHIGVRGGIGHADTLPAGRSGPTRPRRAWRATAGLP